MKTIKLSALLILILFSHLYLGQDDDEINLDVLRAQASPGANLLGIANSDIEKPTDLKSLMISLRQGSDNFSNLPAAFTVDVAPFKLNGKYQNLIDNSKFSENFKQSFVISFGFKNLKEDEDANIEEKSKIGLGTKFSIIRGDFNKETKDILSEIYKYHLDRQKRIELLENDADLLMYYTEKKVLLEKLKNIRDKKDIEYLETDAKINEITVKENKRISYLEEKHNIENIQLDNKIRKDIENLKLERYGFFLDTSMGTVLDFENNKFNNSKVTKLGAWLTGGYNWEKHPSTLIFIGRYLYNPDSPLANPSLKKENIHTLDIGSRLVFKLFDEKFLMSGECMYRSILNKSDFESSWKYLLNFEYELDKNQRLTFSFGKNFDGEYEKKGNLIVALNLIVGLGKVK